MTAPDPLKTVFIDYTDDTAADVRSAGAGTDGLWRKAKRRRAGRTAAAGAAVAVLAVSSGWLLAHTAGAEDPAPPAAEQPAGPADRFPDYGNPNTGSDAMWADAADIAGTAIDLPPFPGGDCGDRDAPVADGLFAPPGEDGTIYLKQVQAAVLAEQAAPATVALFGCGTGADTVFQVVELARDADGDWTAVRQLAASEPGAVPLYLESEGTENPDVEPGVLVGLADRYDPAANDVPYRFERISLDSTGEPVREPAGDLGTDGWTDIDVRIDAVAVEEGVWDFTASVRNDGPRDAAGYELETCALTFSNAVMDTGLGVCEDEDRIALDGLAVGEVRTFDWTMTADVDAWAEAAAEIDDDANTGPVFFATVLKEGDRPADVPRGFTTAHLLAEFTL